MNGELSDVLEGEEELLVTTVYPEAGSSRRRVSGVDAVSCPSRPGAGAGLDEPGRAACELSFRRESQSDGLTSAGAVYLPDFGTSKAARGVPRGKAVAMSYPPGPYEGSPEWQGQQPPWQGQPQPPWQGQQPAGWQGQPQAPQPGWPGQSEPDSHLVWAILCTVLCCLPLGIVSIVSSTKVSGLWAQGRYAEAQSAADSAKKWAIIGAVVGAVSYVIGVVLWFAFVAAVVSTIPSITPTTYSY